MKEKALIRYIRKSKTVMTPVVIDTINGPEGPESNIYYRKEKIYYPRGVLVVVCRDEKLYFGWSYISDMAREKVQVGALGLQNFKTPSFVKKTAIKIAMDKINSRKKMWSVSDMPIAVRKEFGGFFVRAVKYFKTDVKGNVGKDHKTESQVVGG